MKQSGEHAVKKVVLITGASSGIGKACAEHLARLGYQVYGTSRRPAAGALVPGLTMLRMDVDQDDSVQAAIGEILAREQRLDVVINNAGIGISGSVEDTSLAEARAQFETNFFGVLRVCHLVLPVMRKQGSGRIINVSSIAGVIGVPFNGLYCASKFAIEGLTEALRMEMKPHGVLVSMVEPGDINTEMSARGIKTAASVGSQAYGKRHKAAGDIMIKDEAEGPAPLVVAKLMEKIIAAPAPRLRYVVGPLMEKVAILLKTILPARVFEWGLMMYYRAG